MTQTLNSNPNCNNCAKSVKFLYSYGGQIIPRSSDGILRYIGGHTRILSVNRSISFAELMVKFGELTGKSMNLKFQLPHEDLDVLVSIKSDEELKNMIDEYDRVSEVTHQQLKIRALLFSVESLKKISPPPSPVSCFDFHTPSRLQPTRTSPARYFASRPMSSVTQTRFQPTRMCPASHIQSPPCAAACKYCPLAVGCHAYVWKDAERSRCYPHGSYNRHNY